VKAPDGRESRILIRDTWNTDILDEVTPEAGDTVIYKTRYSGFYGTDLDAVLRARAIKWLVVTGRRRQCALNRRFATRCSETTAAFSSRTASRSGRSAAS